MPFETIQVQDATFASGGVKTAVHREVDGTMITRHDQNVDPILDSVQKLASQADHRMTGTPVMGARPFARIPTLLHAQWKRDWRKNHKQYMSWQEYLKKKLNSSEFTKLKFNPSEKL